MKKIYILIISLSTLFSCTDNFNDAVDFTRVQNPTLTINSILGLPGSAESWATGLESTLSGTLNGLVINAELGSDNYVNTQTFFSQLFDILDIRVTDVLIRGFERSINQMRVNANTGLDLIGPNDPNYTVATEAEFNYYLGLSNLFAGMYFSFLPNESSGVPLSSDEHLQLAITSFNNAASLNPLPEYQLAIARANYYLGNITEAISAANAALGLSSNFTRTARYDQANGPANTMEAALFDRATFDDLQPLPTLDFLDPKYSFLSQDEDPPVNYLKAEEAYLILAEANLANNDLSAAQNNLRDLLALVETREVRNINDAAEQRSQVDPGGRPDNAEVIVNGRAGLVLDRQAGNVNIPSVSGTSLTMADIDAMQDDDAGLALLYRTRQEVFIAEGIRFVDMGVKFVITESEITQNPNINMGDPGTVAVIPSFIMSNVNNLDAISYDPSTGIATTTIDLNQILVDNRTSDQVLPFE